MQCIAASARPVRRTHDRSGGGYLGAVPTTAEPCPGSAARRDAGRRRPRRVPRLGAATPTTSACASATRARADRRRRRRPRGARRRRRPARTTSTCSASDELPDPASRHQPEGLRGPSRIVDPRAFAWTDDGLRAAPARRAGHLRAARRHVHAARARSTPRSSTCPSSRELGVTAIEVMPVAEFPGDHGWGYDGVYLSAPRSRPTAGPTGFQRLVDAAHAQRARRDPRRRLQPRRRVGQHRRSRRSARTSPSATRRSGATAINYDDAHSDPVREWVLQSAEGWVRDFHVDGLRLDAIHAIYDTGAEPILGRARRPRARGAAGRARHRRVGPQRPEGHPPARARRLRPRRAVGRRLPPRAARAADRRPRAATTRSSARSPTSRRRSGARSSTTASTRRFASGASARPRDDRPPEQFVVFDQNHDQVGNRAFGDRLPARGAPARARSARCCRRSRRCSSWARSTASRRRFSSSPTTSTRRSRPPRATGAGASSPPSPQFAGEEVPDPQDPRDVRALQAHARARPGARGPLRQTAARAHANCPTTEAVDRNSTRTPAG